MLRYFRPAWARIARIAVGSLFAAQLETLAIVLLVPLAQVVTAGEDRFDDELGPFSIDVSVATLALSSAGAVLFAALINVWLSWQRARMTSEWELEQRNRIVGDYLATSYETQASERLGTLDKLTSFAGQGAIALGAIATGLKASLTLLMFLGSAVVLDARAAAAIVLIGALLFAVLRPAMVRARTYGRTLAAEQLAYGQELLETTRMAPEIRVFDAGRSFSDHLAEMARRIADVRRRAAFISGVVSPAYQYTGMLLVVAALALAHGLGPSDVSALGAVALLLLRSIAFGQQLQTAAHSITESMPYMELFESIRDDYLSQRDTDGVVAVETVRRIDLVDLRYSYDGKTDALAGVNVSFFAGEIVGIVGPSGGGKTTLSHLLLRLRQPSSGRILVNGEPAEAFSRASWASHVSLVPQEPRLFHGTVSTNIGFFDPSISQQDIESAARDAGIDEVIRSLPDGYDTLVGPAFRDLSGGQIQRIGIARALARRADVLVLDEPTSALDVHSEAVIQATMERLRGSALVLIIAHRMSTLSICDRVMVLRDGHLEFVGSLPEAAERSGFFRQALEAGTLEIGPDSAR